MNTGIDKILERKAINDAAKKQRLQERKDSGERQPILIDKHPTGLYFCRYEKGPIPNAFAGMFTSKNKIISIALTKGLEIKEVY